jgi:hypothetical protein
MTITINHAKCCFERNGIEIMYENDFRISHASENDAKYIYTSFSDALEFEGESHNIVEIEEIFNLIDHLNTRLLEKISVYDGYISFLPGNNLIDFDFEDEDHEPFQLTRGYVYLNLTNKVGSKDRILINYINLNNIDIIMDLYPNIFEPRYKLELKFVD